MTEIRCDLCSMGFTPEERNPEGAERCPTCGYVTPYPSDPEGPELNEDWTVLTADTRILAFRSLEELRDAIYAKRVNPGDRFVGDDGPWRLVETVDELAAAFASRGHPLFEDTAPFGVEPAASSGATGALRTAGTISCPPPWPWPTSGERRSSTREYPLTPLYVPAIVEMTPKQGEAGDVTLPLGTAAASEAPLRPAPELDSSWSRSDTNRPFARSEPPSPAAPEAPPSSPVRSARSMAGLSFFLLGGICSAAVVLLAVRSHGGPESVASLAPAEKPRPEVDAAAIDRGIASGDLEAAGAALERALLALPDGPELRVERARVAVERAEVAWLQRKARSESRSTGAAAIADRARAIDPIFAELASAARAAAREALASRPREQEVVRMVVNAERIFGDLDAARREAALLAADATDPETMFTLGTLDLADPEGPLDRAVEKLKVAATASRFPGRARANLIFALVRAGDVNAATKELDKLALLARPHPATDELRALVTATAALTLSPPKAAQAMAARPPRARTETEHEAGPASPPNPPNQGSAECLAPGHDEVVGAPNSGRAFLREAAVQRCRGATAKARKMYEAWLQAEPEDAEALAGLADVARAEDDWTTARDCYARALAKNPRYLPALLGAADLEWEVGDRRDARSRYQQILDGLEGVDLPPRVRERATKGTPPSGPRSESSG